MTHLDFFMGHGVFVCKVCDRYVAQCPCGGNKPIKNIICCDCHKGKNKESAKFKVCEKLERFLEGTKK